MRDYLVRLAIKHEGNYSKIRKALINKEEVDENIELQQAITIFDEDIRGPTAINICCNCWSLRQPDSINGTRQDLPSCKMIFFNLFPSSTNSFSIVANSCIKQISKIAITFCKLSNIK